MKIVNRLVQSIRDATRHNPDVQVVPACILWPDGDRQWEPVIATLQAEMPELFVLGDYAPEKRIGPAIWLRCVIAGKYSSFEIPPGAVPILYLPGVTRQALRAVESCPERQRPLAELQYRGVIWSQINAKDWTILAYLRSDQGGLALDVAQDNDSKNAMQLALYLLLDEEMDLLRGRRLDKDYFNTLLTGGDPVRELLQWLDQGDAFKEGRDENVWRGFVEVCKSLLAFDPENDGSIKGAACLAKREGPWLPVWERYTESAKRYPHIPELIRKTEPPEIDLYSNAKTHGGWPQWNDQQERSLREDLKKTKNETPHDARNTIQCLEEKHSDRRGLVWGELGDAPLACALQHLQHLVEKTDHTMAAGTTDDLSAAYRSCGWLADDAVLRALACINKPDDLEAVTAAIRAVYLPWIEELAQHFQKEVYAKGYPGGLIKDHKAIVHESGHCYFFVDGLRLDVARRLADRLQNDGCTVEETPVWAAVPSVTATGKPAISPVRHLVSGQEANADFEPCVEATGQSLKGGYHLKKLLKDNNWQILDRTDDGNPDGAAWCEIGDIDHEGHERGWKLAKHLDSMLVEIADRIGQLLSAGWKTVHVVTDHGWLLLPGGMPRITLPSSLSENTWGRCAALKPGAVSEERRFPWSWNPDISFALPDGVLCYKARREYAHGGMSLQECLTLELIITPGGSEGGSKIVITDVVWKGLRCKVAIDGDPTDLRLDLRTHAGNAKTSTVMGVKAFKKDGTSSVIIEDEDLDGQKAFITLIDNEDRLVAQKETIIGKESD